MRIGLILLLTGMVFHSQVMGQELETESGPVEVIAIWIYADWCDECEQSEDTFDELREDWHQENTYFRKFDMSDSFTRTGAREFAELMGLKEVFEEYETEPGTFILVDAPAREVMKTYEADFGYTEVDEEIRARLEADEE